MPAARVGRTARKPFGRCFMAERGKVVSFINYKGGVGKTTLTVELAATIADRWAAPVLVMDLDPQTNATFYLVEPAEWEKWASELGTLKDLFDAALAGRDDFDLGCIIMSFPQEERRFLQLVPSHLDLLLIDMKLAARFGPEGIGAVSIIKKALEPVRDRYEVILIDCPPNLNLVTQNALVASDAYVIVTMPEYLSTIGLATIQKAVHELEARVNRSLETFGGRAFVAPPLRGIIFNRMRYVTGGTSEQERIRAKVTQDYPDLVFTNFVPESDRIAQRPMFHTPLALSLYRKDRQWVNALRRVTDEFIEKVL